MATITMEIQFGSMESTMGSLPKKELLKKKKYNDKKELQIYKIINIISDKYGTECDEFDINSLIIESFFDVYFTNDNEDSYENIKNEVITFLEKLQKKYTYANLGWYISEVDFEDEDEDEDDEINVTEPKE